MISPPDTLPLTREERDAIEQLSKRLADTASHPARVSSLRHAIDAQDSAAIGSLLDEGMGLYGPLYPLLLIKECFDGVERLYQKLGISDEVRDETLFDIRRWVDEHSARSGGELGLSQVYWIARHLSGRIVQLGSLQFERKPFGYPYRIYRERGQREPLLLSEGGLHCSRDGYLVCEAHSAYTTLLEEDGISISAHEVDTRGGRIKESRSTWMRPELSLLCTSETEVLNIHIPKGADLRDEAVAASLSLSEEVFPHHGVMVCTSWLIDPALSAVLDEESNIVRFMQRFSKFPVTFSVPQIWERVFGFGFDVDEVLAFTPLTSLQRRTQDALRAGVVFRTMGGVVLSRGASALC